MSDFLTKPMRSKLMSTIKGKNNKDTELVLMQIFRRNCIKGWRRHQNVFGRPDFLFRKSRLAVFVDGCFWHGCPKHFKMPAGNRPFWKRKIENNRARDGRVNRILRKSGWCVVRIWEHELKRPKRFLGRLKFKLSAADYM